MEWFPACQIWASVPLTDISVSTGSWSGIRLRWWGAAGFEAAANLYAHPKNFGFGESIGTSMNITAGEDGVFATMFKVANPILSYSYSSPAFEAGSYLGFTDGQDHYGWLKVTWDPTLGTNGTFEVLSGAYESEAGVSIGAGLTAIPEPGNLLALSGLVGSAMFLRTRRRKNVT
jgi:hypothetical protein